MAVVVSITTSPSMAAIQPPLFTRMDLHSTPMHNRLGTFSSSPLPSTSDQACSLEDREPRPLDILGVQ